MILKISRFDPNTGRTWPRYSIAVRDLAEASRAYQAARESSGEGASTFPSGFIHDASRRIIARVSYNGRVWQPDNETLIQEAAK
jgi:hypothetical protein